MRKNCHNSDAAFNAGNVYNKMENFDAAISMYEKSLEIGPIATDALTNIAIIYYVQKNDCTQASRWALRILKLDPAHKKGNTILQNCQMN